MSLDVYLYLENPPPYEPSEGSGIFVREAGSVREVTREEWNARFPGLEPVVILPSDDATDDEDEKERCVFDANITHNLGKMAAEAGIYAELWHPGEKGITKAEQLIAPLTAGLLLLRAEPERFKAFNPANGWGDYDGLVSFVSRYLKACRRFPTARVSAWA